MIGILPVQVGAPLRLHGLPRQPGGWWRHKTGTAWVPEPFVEESHPQRGRPTLHQGQLSPLRFRLRQSTFWRVSVSSVIKKTRRDKTGVVSAVLELSRYTVIQ